MPTFDYGDVYAFTPEYDVFQSAIFQNVSNPVTAFIGYKVALENFGWTLDTEMPTDFVWAVMY